MRLFQAYHWPGNVRQLFNVLRTACVMAAGESAITRDHLSDDFIDDARRALACQQPEPVMPAVPTAPPGNAGVMPVAAEPVVGVAGGAAMAGGAPAVALPAVELPTGTSLEDIELQTIQRAVEAAGGNISVAAKRLGISRNTIYRKLRWKAPGR